MHKDFESMPMWVRKIEADKYYKIFGQARAFKDKKSINTFSASMIIDFNELTHHFLSVVLNKCIREKGVLSPIEIKEGKRRIQESNEESKDTNERSSDSFMRVETSITPTVTPAPSSPKEIQNCIVQTMRSLDGHLKDIPKDVIFSHLPLKIAREKYEEGLRVLMEQYVVMSNDAEGSFTLV